MFLSASIAILFTNSVSRMSFECISKLILSLVIAPLARKGKPSILISAFGSLIVPSLLSINKSIPKSTFLLASKTNSLLFACTTNSLQSVRIVYLSSLKLPEKWAVLIVVL